MPLKQFNRCTLNRQCSNESTAKKNSNLNVFPFMKIKSEGWNIFYYLFYQQSHANTKSNKRRKERKRERQSLEIDNQP